jgi:site-specific recombinase XerC
MVRLQYRRTWRRSATGRSTRLVPLLGRLTLRQLQEPESAATVRRAYAALSRRLAPRSVQEAHVTLHQALQQAVVDGLLVRNVCEAVTPPKAPRSEARSLTPAEVERLLAAAPVLLLLPYRPGYSPSLGERTYSSRLALSHLPPAKSAALAGAVLQLGRLQERPNEPFELEHDEAARTKAG